MDGAVTIRGNSFTVTDFLRDANLQNSYFDPETGTIISKPDQQGGESESVRDLVEGMTTKDGLQQDFLRMAYFLLDDEMRRVLFVLACGCESAFKKGLLLMPAFWSNFWIEKPGAVPNWKAKITAMCGERVDGCSSGAHRGRHGKYDRQVGRITRR